MAPEQQPEFMNVGSILKDFVRITPVVAGKPRC